MPIMPSFIQVLLCFINCISFVQWIEWKFEWKITNKENEEKSVLKSHGDQLLCVCVFSGGDRAQVNLYAKYK